MCPIGVNKWPKILACWRRHLPMRFVFADKDRRTARNGNDRYLSCRVVIKNDLDVIAHTQGPRRGPRDRQILDDQESGVNANCIVQCQGFEAHLTLQDRRRRKAAASVHHFQNFRVLL